MRSSGRVPARCGGPAGRGGTADRAGTTPLAAPRLPRSRPCVEVARAAAQLEPGHRHPGRGRGRAAPLAARRPAPVRGPAGHGGPGPRRRAASSTRRGRTLTVEARAPGPRRCRCSGPSTRTTQCSASSFRCCPATEGVLPVEVNARAGPADRRAAPRAGGASARRSAASWSPVRPPGTHAAPPRCSTWRPPRVDVLTRVGRTATASRPRGLHGAVGPAHLARGPRRVRVHRPGRSR